MRVEYYEQIKRDVRKAAHGRKLSFQQFNIHHFRIGDILDFWPETGAFWLRTNGKRGTCSRIGTLLDALLLLQDIPESGKWSKGSAPKASKGAL